MSDEWKWVLRSATATRPVLRFSAESIRHRVHGTTTRAAVFSDTRGMFKVSAGEGRSATSVGNEADLGTAFALATSLTATICCR